MKASSELNSNNSNRIVVVTSFPILPYTYAPFPLYNDRPARLADKPWLKVPLVDLLWEKNIIPWLISSSEQREHYPDVSVALHRAPLPSSSVPPSILLSASWARFYLEVVGFISIHPNICGLMPIRLRPNKAWGGFWSFARTCLALHDKMLDNRCCTDILLAISILVEASFFHLFS
jgi:hypothetical protein